MLGSRNRATAMFGTWISVLAGAWFVVGRALAGPLGLGDVGVPIAVTEVKQVWLELTYFYGLGALIVFLGALALGRLSVRTARDIAFADTHAAAAAHPEARPASAVEQDDKSAQARTDGEDEERAAGSKDTAGFKDTTGSEDTTGSKGADASAQRHRWGSLFHRGGHRADPKMPV